MVFSVAAHLGEHVLAYGFDDASSSGNVFATAKLWIKAGAGMIASAGVGYSVYKFWGINHDKKNNDKYRAYLHEALDLLFFSGLVLSGWKVADIGTEIFSEFSGGSSTSGTSTWARIIALGIQGFAVAGVGSCIWNTFRVHTDQDGGSGGDGKGTKGRLYLNVATSHAIFEGLVGIAYYIADLGINTFGELG